MENNHARRVQLIARQGDLGFGSLALQEETSAMQVVLKEKSGY